MAIDQRIFEQYAGGLPSPFLKALAFRESGLNPTLVNPASRATGLFQLTAPVVVDFNRIHGTSYVLEDAKDPILATQIAATHLNQIIRLWKGVPALAANFADVRFVELLVLGWNAGPSAVLKVAKRLTDMDLPPERITAAAVNQAAGALMPKSWIARPERLGFARLVATTYFDGAQDRTRSLARAPKRDTDISGTALLAALGVGAAAVAATRTGDERES